MNNIFPHFLASPRRARKTMYLPRIASQHLQTFISNDGFMSYVARPIHPSLPCEWIKKHASTQQSEIHTPKNQIHPICCYISHLPLAISLFCAFRIHLYVSVLLALAKSCQLKLNQGLKMGSLILPLKVYRIHASKATTLCTLFPKKFRPHCHHIYPTFNYLM